jgi:hypothetical protein
MNLFERTAERDAAAGGRQLARIGAVLVLASSALLAGNADTKHAGTPPSPLKASTEGIGSLPIVIAPPPADPYGDPYGGLIPDRLRGPDDLLRPFVQLSGSLTEIDTLVSTADGKGIVSAVSDAPNWTFGFHGNIHLGVDPVQAARSDSVFGIRVGEEFAGGIAVFKVNGAHSPVFHLVDTTFTLPVKELAELVLFHGASIEMRFLSPYGTRAYFSIRENGGRLIVSQLFE